jgi:signal transduction histidine kinase
MKSQDEERRRMARELHDTTAQSMSMVILDLETVRGESHLLSGKARTALSQSILLARQSVKEIRTFSYLLHPPMLEELGLLAALRIFIDGFSRRSGIQVYKELPSVLPRMPAEWELALFHAVQEGLTNVQRHSHTPTAEVCLTIQYGLAILQIKNEGATVPARASGGLPAATEGVGISGMRERVQACGGHVRLYSEENRTILDVDLPLLKAASASSGAGQA